MMARTPDLSCNCSELTSKPRRESISSWLRMRSAAAAAAGSSCSSRLGACVWSGGGVSSAMIFPLLNDHLFQKNVAHAIGRGGGIDAAQKLFLQTQHAFRSFEIVDPQFAQIRLELIDQAGHQRGHAGFFQVI